MTDTVDPRRSIARLAAAVMAADARVTSSEIAVVAGLTRLGLGRLEAATREELARSVEEPIDVGASCAALLAEYPDAGGAILAALADIAAGDGELDPREVALLGRIGDALRLPPEIVAHVVRTAVTAVGASVLREPHAEAGTPRAPQAPEAVRAASCGAPAAPSAAVTATAASTAAGARAPLAAAYAVLGLEAGAPAAAVDDAYRAVVERYQPFKVLDLGPEFAVLAVRRLAAATAAYTTINKARVRGG